MNEPKDEGEKHENMEKGQGCVDLWKISETEHKTTVSSDGRGAGIVHEELETSSNIRNNMKVRGFYICSLHSCEVSYAYT